MYNQKYREAQKDKATQRELKNMMWKQKVSVQASRYIAAAGTFPPILKTQKAKSLQWITKRIGRE